MTETRRNPQRRGLTLLEVLIAAVLLAMSGVAVMNIFMGANRGIRKTDERREIRHHLVKVFAHANRQSLHGLFDAFGEPAAGAARPNSGYLARYNADGELQVRSGMEQADNPLGITQAYLNELKRDGLSARLSFEFFPRFQLMEGEDPNSDTIDTNIGLEYMQAGFLTVEIVAWDNPDEAALMTWTQPVMCPMIVGRPGIALKSCPALNPAVQCKYVHPLASYEGSRYGAGWNATALYGPAC